MTDSRAKKIAIILAGCGHKVGTEITEAVSVILALSEVSASFDFFAPENVMTEAARISRGKIKNITGLKADDFDGFAIPGGSGLASVLCNFADAGAKGKVIPDVERVLVEFYSAQKPILALCIAPAVVALVLGSRGITLTLGASNDAAIEIKKTGAHVENCAVTDFISDREHKVISTPAYMHGDAKPFEVYTGIRKAVRELVEMA